MIRTTRAVLATAVPSTALALSLVFASAAVAPEAVTAPEATATAAPVPVASASASPTALPWPSTATRSGRGSVTDATTACCAVPPPTSTPSAVASPADDSADGSPAESDSPDGASPAATPAPESPERVPEQQDAGGVDVGVSIDPPTAPGALSMTVADSSATLVESGSTPLRRQFLGALPTVTVTDTRDSAQSPAFAGWYVLGSASDFTGASGRAIGAEHLGWTPELRGTGDAVSAGPHVAGTLDGGPGLSDAVLLSAADDSPAASGSWSATATLLLGTEPTVAAGGYRSTLTLSLFE
ncbi:MULTISPECIES: hypothetical protein [unclassified Rathayibacter]|uniref:hypothetical protein n=1 Tax=unclassified Rathayibacter TaxID=2609250 RepID=UPI000F4C2624|nr:MULTISPECIES: hypothetical protein [unclassified Rathayibacter]ROP45178.1 hypothetical protein EDF45_3697 [Rathayibacter sp. PhB186]ROS47784.1 hypothetical protein EDF44_3617 [Rathayibacter sp. PhB185]